ncbi:Di-copper centre-containing protein [Thozetella sp. PMI_491]|nr:Di-copper centre-containing protein [Thozetella sp. PMI_491]
MKLLGLVWATALAILVAGDAVNDLEAKGRLQINDYIASGSKTCTKDKLSIRKEWGDISKPERRAYIDAVLCLLKAPSKLDPKQFPGAKSRYDDFVVVHMNQTLTIHNTGNFLSWHRYYIWSWENVLRKECGYKGALPYWDYGRWAKDPLSSPIFDGSDTSLGGNGGGFGGGFGGMGSGGRTGGGCVATGPFKNMTIYLGPMSPVATPSPPRNSMSNGYGANPRCLRRDITNTLGMQYGKTSDIATFITSFTKVLDFQNYMQGGSGIHGVGHFTVSGDPGGDFYISPNEPSFWIHHAMIDRTWVIWQSQDYKNRMMQMEGGTSMMGFGGKQQSLDDLVDLGVVGDKVYKIRDLLSSVDGPFCYVYE